MPCNTAVHENFLQANLWQGFVSQFKHFLFRPLKWLCWVGIMLKDFCYILLWSFCPKRNSDKLELDKNILGHMSAVGAPKKTLLVNDDPTPNFLENISNLKSIYANHPHNHASKSLPLLSCINITSSLWWKEWRFALINPLRLHPKPRLNDTFHSVPAVSLICLQDTIFSVLSQG